jgi:23S rRNA U2552 (ribose-2'-O)-methylase RlmE/FtsJ
MWSVAGKSPPWKNIEFYKTPIFFDIPKVLEVKASEWKDQTPQDLIILKDGIGAKESMSSWDLVKRITNPYELIFTSSNHADLPQSISILKPLSRSFFKFVEMFELMNFFETCKVTKYKSLHLCEGPGGFIEAFLDRAERYKKLVSGVWAMTLKQTNHSIPGWRAAGRLLARHPEIHIEYGPQNTGNILETDNQEFLEKTMRKSTHLVTADGGFDFSSDFQAQEKLIFPLLVSSSHIALSCLAPTGCFILKIFDSFSEVTQTFLCILALHFKEFTIYKPVTSRPCNSERYFIGKGFRGFPASSRKLFEELQRLGSDVEFGISCQIDPFASIRTQVVSITGKYVEEQRLALSRVLSFPEKPQIEDIHSAWDTQTALSIQWCQVFHIPSRSVTRTKSWGNISIR